REGQHLLAVPHGLEAALRGGADALGGRVRGDQLGMCLLDRLQATEQLVVLGIRDLRIVEDVVAMVVVRDGAPERGRSRRHVARRAWHSRTGCSSLLADRHLVNHLAVSGALLFLIAILAAGLPSPARAITLPVEAFTLPNGLRLLVHKDTSEPVIASYVFFRAGSRNEQCGATGIAHLFEHMMFNGGEKDPPGGGADLSPRHRGDTKGGADH